MDGYLLAATRDDAVGHTINLGSGREISIGDLVELIARSPDGAVQVVARRTSARGRRRARSSACWPTTRWPATCSAGRRTVASRTGLRLTHRLDARPPRALPPRCLCRLTTPRRRAHDVDPALRALPRRQRVGLRHGVPRHGLGLVGRALRRPLRDGAAPTSRRAATRWPRPTARPPCTSRCCWPASSRTTRCSSPTLTFIAPANAVRYVGASPVFVDAEPAYWQMDADLVAGVPRGRLRDGRRRAARPRTGRRVPRAAAGAHPRAPRATWTPSLELAARVRPRRRRGCHREPRRDATRAGRPGTSATSAASASTATRSSPPAAAARSSPTAPTGPTAPGTSPPRPRTTRSSTSTTRSATTTG